MISVIIPTRNRANLLGSALASLAKQSLKLQCFEILVIDNGSEDTTQNVITEYQSSLPNLTGIYAAEPGLHTGRHAGMKESKGDILVFADDDIEALPTWLASIDEAFQDPAVAMVGGNNYPMFLETPPNWIIKLWNRPTFGGYKAISALSVIEFTNPPQKISPYLVWGCNFAIRRNVLLSAGGFHPDGMPKELIRFRGDGETHVSDFVAKSGMKCVFHPGASVYHKVTPERMTFNYFRLRGFNQGVSDSYTQLRKQGDISKSKNSFLKKALVYTARNAIRLLDDAEMRHVMEQFQIGFHEGYNYHQAIYSENPEVRAWVHRPTYY